MTVEKTIEQPLNSKNYVVITIVGLIISITSVIAYIVIIDDLIKYNLESQIFYLVLLLFGISISAFVFGAMNSYASLKGKRFDTKFNLTGPIVGVVLTVAGGFYLPSTLANEIEITVRLFHYNEEPLTKGWVNLYLKKEIKGDPIDEKGERIFYISKNSINSRIKIEASSDGYKNEVRYLKGTISENIDIIMEKPRYFKIKGKITNADEFPIRNVEVNIENTVFYTHTATNGSYTLSYSKINIGDEISIITSHPLYKDKITNLTINKINEELNIVLAPLK